MTHEFRIGGVLISSIVPTLVVALILTILLSMVLVRIGFYKLVWQRPLVDLSIFFILAGLIVVLLPDGGWPLF